MRGCAFVLVMGALVALGAAWFGAPAVAGLAIHGALVGAGFQGDPVSVRVIAEPPVAILGGRADRVEVAADAASFRDMTAERLEITLFDVELASRTFASVDGLMTGVTVDSGSRRIAVERIELGGRADATQAVAGVAGFEVARAATDALNDAIGLPVGRGELVAPNRLRFTVAGTSAEGTLLAEPDGSLWLVADLPGRPRIRVIDADPLDIRSVSVVDGRLVLIGTLDLGALIRG